MLNFSHASNAIIILMLLGVCAYGFINYSLFYHDDAYISLRYAHNFINGHGLTWNRSERVEGYTNFLFVVLVSFMGTLEIDLATASRILGTISYALLIFSLIVILKRYPSSPEAISIKFLPIVLTANCFSLIIWSLGGMETLFFTLLAFIGVSQFVETLHSTKLAGILVGLCFGLAAMTRPEGVLFFAASFLFLLLTKKGIRSANWQYSIGFFISFVSFYGIYFIWRLLYYGDFFPNTFYVKAGFNLSRISNGLQYCWEFFFSPPFFGVLSLIALFFALWRGKVDRKVVYLFFIQAAFLGYVIYIGGDHMPAFRFLVPMVPLFALSLYHVLSWERCNRYMIYGFVLLFTILQIFLPSEQLTRAKKTDQAAFVGAIVGKYIVQHFPEKSSIALNTAGSTPYFAPRHTFIDMLGLNDRTIGKRKITKLRMPLQKKPGHEKGDGKYVLKSKPDFIIVGPAEGTDISNPWFLSDLELSESESFYKDYKKQTVMIDVTKEKSYQNYSITQEGILIFTYYSRINHHH